MTQLDVNQKLQESSLEENLLKLFTIKMKEKKTIIIIIFKAII